MHVTGAAEPGFDCPVNESDLAEVTAAIKDVPPNVEVAEMVAGTYYPDDPFARGDHLGGCDDLLPRRGG